MYVAMIGSQVDHQESWEKGYFDLLKVFFNLW